MRAINLLALPVVTATALAVPGFVRAKDITYIGTVDVEPPEPSVVDQPWVKGTVFEDLNRNSQYDVGEPGIADVLVSNGVDVVVTNSGGKYRLPALPSNENGVRPIIHLTLGKCISSCSTT